MKKPAAWAGFFDLYFYFTGLEEIVGQLSRARLLKLKAAALQEIYYFALAYLHLPG